MFVFAHAGGVTPIAYPGINSRSDGDARRRCLGMRENPLPPCPPLPTSSPLLFPSPSPPFPIPPTRTVRIGCSRRAQTHVFRFCTLFCLSVALSTAFTTVFCCDPRQRPPSVLLLSRVNKRRNEPAPSGQEEGSLTDADGAV